MQDAVLVILVATLLILILWTMGRGRSDKRLRLWLIGLCLVIVHFVSLLGNPISSQSILAATGLHRSP